jgi:hypothetical protein
MSKLRLNLCLNCLEPGAVPVPIGGPKGHQMDQYYEEVQLCPVCKAALEEGDFRTLSNRFAEQRTVTAARAT